jgi:2,4-dienoyl-CoA reductase-like NADH-dependent reductase (Old Yellow Enzyme family)
MLFDPLTIKDITLRNRIVMSPMCQYAAHEGFANNWHLVHYTSRAAGGTGLIIQEATAVSPEGRITPGDLGIYADNHIDKLREINAEIHQLGAVAGIQIAHAGRKAGCALPWNGGKQLKAENDGWQTLAPSALAFQEDEAVPHMLSALEIRNLVTSFGKAAQRSYAAGFRVLEIHAAHGYLIHEFLSPLSNKRTDEYGGSFEKRIRFLLEIVNEVKTEWPENLPLFVRISATDYVEGGWNVDEAVELSAKLKSSGVDLMDVSSGGLVPYATIPFGPEYQVPFAERVKKEAGIRSSAVGMITRAQQAEDILQQGKADLILFGRELLRNPYFAQRAAKELSVGIEWPLQYLRAKD